MIKVGQIYKVRGPFSKPLLIKILEIRQKEAPTDWWYEADPSHTQRRVERLSYIENVVQMGRWKLVRPNLKLTIRRTLV